jgi:hypothetical protein
MPRSNQLSYPAAARLSQFFQSFQLFLISIFFLARLNIEAHGCADISVAQDALDGFWIDAQITQASRSAPERMPAVPVAVDVRVSPPAQSSSMVVRVLVDF